MQKYSDFQPLNCPNKTILHKSMITSLTSLICLMPIYRLECIGTLRHFVKNLLHMGSEVFSLSPALTEAVVT